MWPEEPRNADCNGNFLPDECDGIVRGDFDGDGAVSLYDYAFFTECFRGPDLRPLPPDYLCVEACLVAFDILDHPRPQTVDLADFAALQNLMGQPAP